MLKRCRVSSSESDGSYYGDSSSDDSYGSDSETSSSTPSSSDSEDEGEENLQQAQQELCLGCNKFTSCTLPRKPSVASFILRHLNVAPAPKVLPKQKRHLEGWGADMIRKGGKKYYDSVMNGLQSTKSKKIYCSFDEGVSEIFEHMDVPFSLMSDCYLIAFSTSLIEDKQTWLPVFLTLKHW